MQLVSILREFRGSAHLIAIRAVGLDDKRAQFIQRPNDAAMFGWGPDDAPTITDEQRVLLERSEQLTDELVLPAYSVLNEAGQAAFLAGLVAIETVLAG